MEITLLIGLVGILFVILVAAGGVVKFAWTLYIKIMSAITDNAEAVHTRINKIISSGGKVKERLVRLETKAGIKNRDDEDDETD